MKIGCFAKKHCISVDTIRYYIEQQLLLPHKKGTQFSFTQEDSRDIEEILELKRIGFSLNEIQSILSYRRLTSSSTTEYKNHLRAFLENKKSEVVKQKQELYDTIVYIEGKINQLKLDEKNKNILGVPLMVLNYLVCPKCKNGLILSEGKIDNNMVVYGELNCKCSYVLKIEKGMIVDKTAIKEKVMPTKKEYYENTSSKFINFLYSSIASLINMINSNEIEKKFILELGSCCGFFLLQYLPYLPKNATYILIDYDFNRLLHLKNNLELHYDHENFIFLCCNMDMLPLKDNCIDLLIDCFATELHEESGGTLLSTDLLPLMSIDGYLGGIYPYFSGNAPTEKSISKNFYNKSYITDMLKLSKIKTLKDSENGPISEGGLYNSNVNGNDRYNYIFLGKIL